MVHIKQEQGTKHKQVQATHLQGLAINTDLDLNQEDPSSAVELESPAQVTPTQHLLEWPTEHPNNLTQARSAGQYQEGKVAQPNKEQDHQQLIKEQRNKVELLDILPAISNSTNEKY